MARIDWNGPKVLAGVVTATQIGVDATMADCVEDAKANHPPYPPASEPGERYANRDGFETGSIRILDNANGIAASMLNGGVVSGSWGALARYSLLLEIGTPIEGPTASARELAGAYEGPFVEGQTTGWPGVAEPSDPPLMAPRPFLRPAADMFYPELAAKIGIVYRGGRL